jgi:hypothetical protein
MQRQQQQKRQQQQQQRQQKQQKQNWQQPPQQQRRGLGVAAKHLKLQHNNYRGSGSWDSPQGKIIRFRYTRGAVTV